MRNCSCKWENYVLKQEAKFVTRTKKTKQINKHKLRLISFFMLLVFAMYSYGQMSVNNRNKTTEKKNASIPFKDRWAFRTNAVDWILLLPNITAEFDLFNSPYKHYTLSLGVRGNWHSSQNYVPDIVYNLLDIRSEFRWYHRTSPRSYRRPDSLKVSLFKRLEEDVFTWKRFHPRYWRAYYIGAYVDACNYSLKFGKDGYQGTAYGLGISGGFGIPLYAYKKNCLDLEFGASVGMVYTNYDLFQRDAESNCYPVVQSKHRDFHFLPYPVISELRVAFVYRFASIKNKYTQIDEAKREARIERKRLQILARDSVNEMRARVQHVRELQRDSVTKAKEAQKLQKTVLKDSLQQAKLLEKKMDKAEKDSIHAAAKLQKKLEKKNKQKEVVGDSVTSKKLRNIVDDLQADSLPAKIEIVPIEEMPNKEKMKSDTLQTSRSDSTRQVTTRLIMKGMGTLRGWMNVNRRVTLADRFSQRLLMQASLVMQTTMKVGLVAGIKRERSRA